jgi:glycine/D-amino acid oxidase-like deaminating enzyme
MEFSGHNRSLHWSRVVSIAQSSKPYLGDWFQRPDELVGRISDPWVGGRPMLPDGLPLVDRLPHLPNAYVATGHGMLGVSLGPVTGRALASYVVNGRRPHDLAGFDLARVPGALQRDP